MQEILYGETTNNHEEADTLLIHYITSSKLDDKRVCVYDSDVDVAVLLIAHRSLWNCRMFTLELVLKRLTSIVFLSFLVVNKFLATECPLKWFLFDLKSSFRSQDILIYVLAFW